MTTSHPSTPGPQHGGPAAQHDDSGRRPGRRSARRPGRTGLLAALLASALGVTTIALATPHAASAPAAAPALTPTPTPTPAAATTAAAAAPAPGEVVVDEAFNGPGLPAGWTAVEGPWKVENGRLVGASTDWNQQTRITFGRHLTDFRIEVTARFETVVDSARWTALGLDVPASGATPWSIATMRSGTTAAN
ncbi:hypothetical protein ABT093_40820, partial [Kitasatospora sp. NPDC002551]